MTVTNKTERSHDLEMVEQYLRANFKKPQRGLLARLFGESPDYDCRIIGLEEHAVASQIIGLRLLWVSVEGSYLDQVRLPIPRSWGLFAVSGQTCLHLNARHPEKLSQFLRLQRNGIGLCAEALAVLFCDAVLSDKNLQYTVLKSVDSLVTASAGTASVPIADDFWSRPKNVFKPASKTTEGERTIVQFFAQGRGFNIFQIYHFEFELSEDSTINYTSEVLMQKYNCIPRRN